MDNWGGARWTYNRKPRKFFERRKPIFHDEGQSESWEFKPPSHYQNQKKDYKAIFAKRIKQQRIAKRIAFFLVSIPLFITISFIIFNSKTVDNQSASDAFRSEKLIEDKKVYQFLVHSGNIYLKQKEYYKAIQEYELALNTGIATKTIYENLLFASIMCCENTNKYCDRINHYEAVIQKNN